MTQTRAIILALAVMAGYAAIVVAQGGPVCDDQTKSIRVGNVLMAGCK